MIQNISMLAMLIPNTIFDLKCKKVWMPFILPFFVEGVIFIISGLVTPFMFFTGALMGLVFMLISYVTKGAIGMGDGYIICAIGCLIGGYRAVMIVTAAMFLAAVVGIILMVFFRWGRKRTIPFVPFLLIAAILNMILV